MSTDLKPTLTLARSTMRSVKITGDQDFDFKTHLKLWSDPLTTLRNCSVSSLRATPTVLVTTSTSVFWVFLLEFNCLVGSLTSLEGTGIIYRVLLSSPFRPGFNSSTKSCQVTQPRAISLTAQVVGTQRNFSQLLSLLQGLPQNQTAPCYSPSELPIKHQIFLHQLGWQTSGSFGWCRPPSYRLLSKSYPGHNCEMWLNQSQSKHSYRFCP